MNWFLIRFSMTSEDLKMPYDPIQPETISSGQQ